MELVITEIPGVYIIENFTVSDNRGAFVKTFNEDFFDKNNLCHYFRESYYSISKKNVIRGMHFQLPPSDHDKLVYVPKGKIIDVVLDLRANKDTYGKYISIELSEENNRSIYIPKGLAHGFKSLEENTITVYNVSTTYNKECDYGISWDSFDLDWNIKEPHISERDSSFMSFNDFKKMNPFR